MKNCIVLTLLLWVLYACNTTPPQASNAPLEAVQHDAVVAIVDQQAIIDSLSELEAALALELEALTKNFDYKQQDLQQASYYHHNWRGLYYISDEALLAGVDSLGQFFLIANVWAASHSETNLDSIQVSIDGVSYTATSDTTFSLLTPSMVVCACGFHQAYFTDANAQAIGQAIAQQHHQTITWDGIKTLTQRDKIGIKETFELSEQLSHLLAVQLQQLRSSI